jgi:hypothetical protein
VEATAATWVIAVAGLVLMLLLGSLQLVAVVRPRAEWTVENVYGGSPDRTDPTAYFAYNQGYWYTAVTNYIWDRDLGFPQPTFMYWVIVWAIWPAFGIIEGVYCFVRLME